MRNDVGGKGQLADVGGVPTILFARPTEVSDVSALVVQQWDGTSWSDLGAPLTDPYTERFNGDGSLATIGGTPYVAIATTLESQPPGIRVLRYDGTGWVQVDDTLRRSATADPHDPVMASVGGAPLVAWREDGDGAQRLHASAGEVSTPPDTTITGTETATNAGVASYGFTATPSAGASFECSYDDEPFAPCTSPHTSEVLDPGAHRFRVRATSAGGTDPTPATRDFVVDRVAPTTTIRLDGNRTPQGAFAGLVTVDADVTDPALSSGIRNTSCVIDPPTPPTSFGAFGSQPCGIAVTALGTHTAYAVANDAAGNASAIVSATFLIAAAPDTIITSGPSGDVHSLPATWAYRTTTPGSTFECRMDVGAWEPCPASQSYLALDDGVHTFSVRAVGPTGVVDPTPDSRTITLGTKRINGSCSGDVPFGEPASYLKPFDLGGVKCVALDDFCPAGSKCTVTLTAGVTDADTDTAWASDGAIKLRGASYASGGSTRCYSTVEELYAHTPPPAQITERPCAQQYTSEFVGPAAVEVECLVERNYFGSGYNGRGPDSLRRHTCAATLDVRPVRLFAVTATGKTGATTVPGPGQLAITGALVGPPSATASVAAIQAATLPGPAFKIRKKVKSQGVVKFPIGLKGEAKRIFNAGDPIDLELTTTFTAKDGTITTTQEVITVQRIVKQPRVRIPGGSKRCKVFPESCP